MKGIILAGGSGTNREFYQKSRRIFWQIDERPEDTCPFYMDQGELFDLFDLTFR